MAEKADKQQEVFNKAFQQTLLKELATNVKFAVQHGDLIKPEYFDEKPMRVIFEVMRDHVLKYDKEINLQTLVTELDVFTTRRGLDSSFEAVLIDEAKEIYKLSGKGEQYVVDRLTDFARRQAMKQALVKAVEIVKDHGDYGGIMKEVDAALSVGAGADMGYDFESLWEIQSLYRDQYRPEDLITTGFPTLDASLKGGMAPGEVHVVMGPPKSGKSTIACCIGAHAIMRKKNVFHVSLEIKAHEVLAKYAARMSNMTLDDILDRQSPQYKERMSKFRKRTPGLFVQYYTELSVDCLAVRAWISKIRAARGVKPDLIILDYDDCLLSTNRGNRKKDGGGTDMYMEASDIYADIKALADYFKCPILTMAQPNRPAWNKYQATEQMIDAADLAHSGKKAMKATSISSINFKRDEDDGFFYMDIVRRGVGNKRIPLRRHLEKAAFTEGHDGPLAPDDEDPS
jgi:hypothetical protein